MNQQKNVKKNEKTKAREITLKILYKNEFHNEIQQHKIIMDEDNTLDEITKDYVNKLLEGVKKYQTEIDNIIDRTSQSWKIERMSLIDLNIVRIAVYEMLYSTKQVPFKVCINEAVEMAKTYGTEDSTKFINGLLDKISNKVQYSHREE